MDFFERVYETVMQIPLGKVATYGQIASKCGSPRSARVVGWALHVNPRPGIIPCHRVVNRKGYLSGGFAFGGIEVQKTLLEGEGVAVDESYCVDLEKYLWKV
ncbi:MAG: Methylated-DNA--protein-cysteine methyltransferase [Firmicutes bacterium ADurb.Bin193]|nr:MAG: Methylated-DNA--protein-cysteine methyltransferase [Firmicutes bacterium ADurb.Bin193]